MGFDFGGGDFGGGGSDGGGGGEDAPTPDSGSGSEVQAEQTSEAAQGSATAPPGDGSPAGAQAQAPDATEDAPKRFRVGDHELTVAELEELRQRASDDYEFVVKGEGQEHRIKRSEIAPVLSMGVGGLKRMREYTEKAKGVEKFMSGVAAGGQELMDAIEQHIDREKFPNGVYDWAAQTAREQFQREWELTQLAKKDPDAALAKAREYEREDQSRRQRIAQEKAERERQAQERQRATQERNARIPAAVQSLGYPVDPKKGVPEMLVPHINQVLRSAQEAGYAMDVQEVAQHAHKALQAELRSVLTHLASGEKGAAAVLELLGPDVAEAVRKHQLEVAKAAAKPAAAKPAAQPRDESEQARVRREGDAARQKESMDILRSFGIT